MPEFVKWLEEVGFKFDGMGGAWHCCTYVLKTNIIILISKVMHALKTQIVSKMKTVKISVKHEKNNVAPPHI